MTICIEANFIFFELRTIEFDIHHHVYIVEHSSIYETVNSNTLYTPVPLKLRHITIFHHRLLGIVPKHRIVQTVEC